MIIEEEFPGYSLTVDDGDLIPIVRYAESNLLQIVALDRRRSRSLHNTAGANVGRLAVDTPTDKDLAGIISDKHIQKNLNQSPEKAECQRSSLDIIKLSSNTPILTVIGANPTVVPLEIHKVIPKRVLKIVTVTLVHDMEDRESLPYVQDSDDEPEIFYELDVATAEVVAAYMANEDLPDSAEWSLVHDDEMALTDASSISSPASSLSPLPPPRQETDEILSLYQCSANRCRTPSVISNVAAEEQIDIVAPEQAPVFTIIVNGKPHAHPLRSHPVKEVDYVFSQPSFMSQVLPRTDSLPSEADSRESDSEISPLTSSRPLFPPRMDSLVPSSAFLAAKIARPSTSHSSSFISQADSITPVTILSQLSPTTPSTPKTPITPTQKAVQMIHRRSASVADLLNSFAGKAMNRSQLSLASQVSPPILIHAPIKSPTTATVPVQIEVPAHAPTPYSMQRPIRSKTWNASQLPKHVHDNNSNLSVNISRNRNASQTSLHSSNHNRKAFVMQGPNTSVFSVHSQSSHQDLHGMFSGYDTHPTNNFNGARKSSAVPPPVPSTPEEIVPVTLKERRFKRILNLRRANAVRSSPFQSHPISELATHTATNLYHDYLTHANHST